MIVPLKILIVDDNLSYRKYLARVIQDIDGVEVVPPAANGRIALSRIRRNPVDLVLLDMQMPEMSGLDTLRHIRESHPGVGVIIISGEYAEDADVVIRALELGAIDFLPKAPLTLEEVSVLALRRHLGTLFQQVQGRRNLNRAKRLSMPRSHRDPHIERPAKTERNAPSKTITDKNPSTRSEGFRIQPARSPRIDVMVMGASTGGPNALNEIIPKLPGDLGIPILVIQHMPALLTSSLAESLNGKSALQVGEALDGEMVRPNRVYVAPGGRHLVVTLERSRQGLEGKRVLRLNDAPPENSVRPSADVLFRSVAEAFDGHTLAIILTGMGTDGMKGIRAMKQRGCYCITQTSETCVVYGMPRSVDDAGLSDERVDLDAMVERILEVVQGSAGRSPS